MDKYRKPIIGLIVSAVAIIGIAKFEGYRGKAYRDVVGIPTIGFGETKGVRIGDTTTPERAMTQLLKSTNRHADGIKQCIKVPLHQYEFDAYVSLAYNIGVGNFCKSTLVKKLNSGDYKGACLEIKKWNRAGGKVNKGLVSRREKEYLRCINEIETF